MIAIRMSDDQYYSEASRDIGALAKKARKSGAMDEMTLLSKDFKPGPFDVICARGKHAKEHTGNHRFRQIIEMSLLKYDKAGTKLEKSLIVSSIVDSVRQASPDGGFVKEENGRWYEVGDHIAREKVGQCLRDSLHTKYKSSTKAKKSRRKQMEKRMGYEVDRLMESNRDVAESTMEQISKSAKEGGSADERMERIFNQANEKLLQQIKRSERSYHREHTAGMGPMQHSEYPYRQEHTLNYEPIHLEDAVDADLPPLDSSSLQHIFADSRRNDVAAAATMPTSTDFPEGQVHFNASWSRLEEEEDDDKPQG